MPFQLPALPFAPDALAPWTTAETFSYHHGKHHAAYVKKLNDAIVGTPHEAAALEAIIAATRGTEPGIFNNAAQHWNHAFFWECLAAEESAPPAALAELLARDFGSVDACKEQFAAKALALFGSGWAWLVQNADGTLAIGQYKDAETPVGTDATPLLTLDVWEHAYYIDHRNDRAGFIAGFWKHVHWTNVAGRLR